MNTKFLLKVADVLDSLAEENSKLSQEKEANERKHREQIIAPFLSKLSFLSGEEPEVLKQKLASADPEVLEMLSKVAGSNTVSELGSPSNIKSASAPLSKRETFAAAEDNFARWCVS
jgi:hypothetical protein